MSFLQCTPKKYVPVFTARQKTISMPSGHMSEFPSSLPISILLGCDTRPDVAAPLTSRVSLLTGFVDCSSGGAGGEMWRRSTWGVHPWCKLDVPLCSCHILLIKPLYSPEGKCEICCVVLLRLRVASLLAKCFLIHPLYTLLCFLSMVIIQCVVWRRWRARLWGSDKKYIFFSVICFIFMSSCVA